jgi:hypothetical protein
MKMATNNLDEIARVAMRRFIDEVVFDQFGISGSTENITDWLLGHTSHFISFYNVVKSHVIHGGGLTEVESGVFKYVEPTSTKVPAKKQPFMWAAEINGRWYIANELGCRYVSRNLWLSIFDRWSAPGYADLYRAPHGWVLHDLDPRKV